MSNKIRRPKGTNVTINNNTSTSNKVKGRRQRRRRYFRGRRNRRGRRNIPAAMRRGFNASFNILERSGTTMTVSGRDLVYPVPNTASDANQSVIAVIPSNPAYWTGTRVGTLAQGYQTFRPLQFTVTYVPQVAVTQEGNVIAGTLWNDAPASKALQQSLTTSNGGFMTQCYATKTATVKLRANLQFNLFRMGGQYEQESNPFNYIAIAVGCTREVNGTTINVIPGYFYVKWKYTFKNPIGESLTYATSGMSSYEDVDTSSANVSMVYLAKYDPDNEPHYKPNPSIPTGAILQVERHKDPETGLYNDIIPQYNGSAVDVDGGDLVWAFTNTTLAEATRAAVAKYQQESRKTIHAKHYLETINIDVTISGVALYSYIGTDGIIYSRVYMRTSGYPSVTFPAGGYYAYALATDGEQYKNQDFGTISTAQGSLGFTVFRAPVQGYELVVDSDTKHSPVKVNKSPKEPKAIEAIFNIGETKPRGIPEQEEESEDEEGEEGDTKDDELALKHSPHLTTDDLETTH